MALVRSPNRAVPVLGGVALALMVLATMIGNVQAQQGTLTVCQQCQRSAANRANTPPNPCAALSGQDQHLNESREAWRHAFTFAGHDSL